MKYIFQILRPQQWIKNTFVFLPLFFGGQLLNIDLLLQCVVVFFAFSFAASAIYCLNDVYDVELDKLHATKRLRPLAAGKISKTAVFVLMCVCIVLSMLVLLLFAGSVRFVLMALVGF
ncbi:MAG: UbiA family prenyltransferase, partial [Bacteroidales bacterium]|nr:UbiA family prenyltransferase [Bacteroidales bacterium]